MKPTADLSSEFEHYLLQAPALTPPPGVVPNFLHDSSKDPLCYGITGAGIGLVTLAVLLRLYAKIFCAKKMKLEDCGLRLESLTSVNLLINIRSHDCILGMRKSCDLRVVFLRKHLGNANWIYVHRDYTLHLSGWVYPPVELASQGCIYFAQSGYIMVRLVDALLTLARASISPTSYTALSLSFSSPPSCWTGLASSRHRVVRAPSSTGCAS